MQVVCAHCDTMNRVDPARAGAGAVCGQCKGPLFPGEPVALSGSTFERYLSRNELPVVVDFWAAWCAPCRAMAPQFAAAARDLAGRVQFAKVDTEAAPELAQRHAIRGIPTVILFRGGVEQDRLSGAMSADQLKRWLESR